MSSPAAGELDLELKKLLVGTNDQRRRFGQTLFHFYRTLVFWRTKGLSFYEVTRAWSAGGAAVFDAMAGTLRELDDPGRVVALRRFVSDFLSQLAQDLERGDHLLVPFLRWLEARFPELTAMMQAEDEKSRIYDVELAEVLARMLAYAARSEREDLVGIVREASEAIGA